MKNHLWWIYRYSYEQKVFITELQVSEFMVAWTTPWLSDRLTHRSCKFPVGNNSHGLQPLNIDLGIYR
jgi:hypothetical protein